MGVGDFSVGSLVSVTSAGGVPFFMDGFAIGHGGGFGDEGGVQRSDGKDAKEKCEGKWERGEKLHASKCSGSNLVGK